MTLRVTIYRLGVIPLLLILCLLAACSAQELEPDWGDRVNLKVLASATTRGKDGTAESLPDVEKNIYDLSVYIFDSNGKAIAFKSEKFDKDYSTPKSVNISTHRAAGCTLYVVANAIRLSADGNTSPFKGVSTLSDFKKLVLQFASVDKQANPDCLLMVGRLAGFDTSSSSTKVALKRLAAKVTFNITVNSDKATSLPIKVDSYQLCHVPDQMLYQQDNFFYPSAGSSPAPSMPSGEINYRVYPPRTPKTASPITYTCYVPANSNTSDDSDDKVTYLKIKAHCQADENKPESKVWESEFKIKLPKDKNSNFESMVLPNYRYTLNIMIQGSASADGGKITSYSAYPFFSGGNLEQWNDHWNDNNGQVKIDFDYYWN